MNDEDTEELTELFEEDFLKLGEPDPEFEYILHYNFRMFDFITKEIGQIADASEFCSAHDHTELGEETIQFVLANLHSEMHLQKNQHAPNQ